MNHKMYLNDSNVSKMNKMYQITAENQGKFEKSLKSLSRSGINSFDLLAEMFFRYGQINPSQQFIANKLNYVRETINRNISKLVRLGLIEKIPQKRKMKGYACAYKVASWITKDMCKEFKHILKSFDYFHVKYLCSRTDLFIKNKKVTLVNYINNKLLYYKKGRNGRSIIKETIYGESNIFLSDRDIQEYNSTFLKKENKEIEEICEKRLKRKDNRRKVWYSWEVVNFKNKHKGNKMNVSYIELETPAIKKVCEKYNLTTAGKAHLRAVDDDIIYAMLEKLEEHPEIVNPVVYITEAAEAIEHINWHRALLLKELHGIDKKDRNFVIPRKPELTKKQLTETEYKQGCGEESNRRAYRDDQRANHREQQLHREQEDPTVIIKNFEKIINSAAFKKLKTQGWSEIIYAKGMIIPLILEEKLSSSTIDYLFNKYPFLMKPTAEAWKEKKTSEQCKHEAMMQLTQGAICATNERPQKKDDDNSSPF